MRVFEVREPFGIDALTMTTRPEPVPGPRDVVIKLHALSLNYRDDLIVKGVWRAPEPRIPVSDGVGVIVAAGAEVSRVNVGDRVAPIFYPDWIDGGPAEEKMGRPLGGRLADGLYAEYALANEESIVTVPAHLSHEEAATLPCAALTAWNAVAERRRVQPGDTVVVLGTGGVALFALQFAKSLGARVIVTSSSDQKLERAKQLGADGGINYRTTPDWWNGLGADLVVDTAGSLAESIDAIRIGGTIAFIGFVRGTRSEVDLISLMGKSATIHAIDVGSRAMFEAMNAHIESQQLRPVIDRVFAFEEAHDAFRYLGSGAHFGKIGIRV